MTDPHFARLQQSLSQGFKLEPKAIFQEAWQRIYGAKFPMLMAVIGVVGCWLVLNQLLLAVLGDEPESLWSGSLPGLLISMVMAPMSGGLDMMGVHRAANMAIRPSQIFDYFRYLLPLAVASLLMGLLTSLFLPLGASLGLSPTLAMLPTLVLSVALMFTFPLMLEKGLSPLQAIGTSIRLFLRQWLNMLLLHALLVLLFMVAVASFGIGLIWVVPFYIVVKGIIYRQACGIGGAVAPDAEHRQDTDVPSSSSKDHFEA
ncbi:DUF2189 domain-containing protein [Zobellella maritima]|uniref:hypothetical protein n=1 Tax=Zobellella maritima TaxID=2059725 RepID=UPI000E309E5D|nr:hypothetical protein [Zobellella maritima]